MFIKVPRFFVENDSKTETIKGGYRMLVETAEKPFIPGHYNWFLATAVLVQYFNA